MAQPISEHFNTDFCSQVASQVLEARISNATSNFVVSPLSFHVMLSLAASGSRGHTSSQLLRFLQSPSPRDLKSSPSRIIDLTLADHDNGGPLLSFVNGARVDRKFNLKPCFEAIRKDTYKAEMRNVDFVLKNIKSNPAMLNQKFRLVSTELKELRIPKFKFLFEFEATDTMKKLGLQLLFRPGELTEMVDCPVARERLYVSNMFHKTCIEVNKEGTEAAACTAPICRAECLSTREYPSFVWRSSSVSR